MPHKNGNLSCIPHSVKMVGAELEFNGAVNRA